jgi:putative transposase
LSERRFLLHDRDAKFTGTLDEVFWSECLQVIRTPVRSPRANAYVERFIGTLRRERLDWILMLGRRHLEAVVREYLVHYNAHRPHRSLELRPPASEPHDVQPESFGRLGRVRRQDRLGGLIHEYCLAA